MGTPQKSRLRSEHGLIGPRIYLVDTDIYSIVGKSFLISVDLNLAGTVFNHVATYLHLDFLGKAIKKTLLQKSR